MVKTERVQRGHAFLRENRFPIRWNELDDLGEAIDAGDSYGGALPAKLLDLVAGDRDVRVAALRSAREDRPLPP